MRALSFFPVIPRSRSDRITPDSAQEKLLMALDLHGLRESALDEQCWCLGAGALDCVALDGGKGWKGLDFDPKKG